MMRYCLLLSCGHNLLSDEPVREGERDFCRGCGFTMTITKVFLYRDEEATA